MESLQTVLSFDVEEHDRIEAAANTAVSPELQAHCRARLTPATQWLLDELDRYDGKATFFIVGQIAVHTPGLIRLIHSRGHEVASHGWDHRRVSTMSPAQFRADVRQTKDALEQLTGQPVVGYRAPTFSIGRTNPWAIDVLAESGVIYDSSIFPVRHDRYGTPMAPRTPFHVQGENARLWELPPATWRFLGMNAPMGGGGYFRLFPLWCTKQAVRQANRIDESNPAMLYFHPWEFDTEQQQLPLSRLNRVRTYIGRARGKDRLQKIMQQCRTLTAAQLVNRLNQSKATPSTFRLGDKRPETEICKG